MASPLLRALLLVCCYATFVASQGIVFPGLNETPEGRCQVAPSDKLGWCRPIEDCPPMLKLIGLGGKPKICGYNSNIPIVCCPTFIELLIGTNRSDTIKLNTVTAPEQLPSCGRRSVVLTELSRNRRAIVGGEEAVQDNWPWMALLGRNSSGALGGVQWYCSAVLLNTRWLLTAAHCFKFGPPDLIRLGEHDHSTTTDMADHVDYTVNRVVQYPEYRQSYHDLALIELTEDVLLRTGVSPVCLPWDDEGLHDLLNEDVTITGWGATSFGGEHSSILQEASVTVFPTERCIASYSTLPSYSTAWPEGITQDTFLCAGTDRGGIDSCQGDSGGPLVYFNSNTGQFVLRGIVSKGYGCGSKRYPGLYVPVAEHKYLKWIKDVAF